MNNFLRCECVPQDVGGYRFCAYHEWVESVIFVVKWAFWFVVLVKSIDMIILELPRWCNVLLT